MDENQAQQQLKALRISYCYSLLATGIIVLIYETGLLPVGELVYDSTTNYVMEIVSVGQTLIGIPLGLKFMHLKQIQQNLKAKPERYLSYGILRMLCIQTPMIINVVFYYMMGFDATQGYLALICLIAMFFVWPSRGKMEYELKNEYHKDEQN